jgi:hypothetical protein
LAAAKGAQIVCLQELFTSLYFCDVEDHENFKLAEVISEDLIGDFRITVYDDNTASIRSPNLNIDKTSLPFEINIAPVKIKISSAGEINVQTVQSFQTNIGSSNQQHANSQIPISRWLDSNKKQQINNTDDFDLVGSNNILELKNPAKDLNIIGSNNDVTVDTQDTVIKITGSNNSVFIRGTVKNIESVGSNNSFRFLKS